MLLHLHDLVAKKACGRACAAFCAAAACRSTNPAARQPTAPRPVALQPEAVDVDVKIVLIGSVEEYYALQEADPDTARRFRAKVDFVSALPPAPPPAIATAIFVAHSCKKRGLPHFGPPPWRCCWSKPTARPTTRAAKAPCSPTPKPC
jgi:hypothetical protein